MRNPYTGGDPQKIQQAFQQFALAISRLQNASSASSASTTTTTSGSSASSSVSTFQTADKTANYTLTARDSIVICNGTFTVTLPKAAFHKNKTFYIKNKGTGVITLTGNGVEEIDEETSQTLDDGDCILVVSDGTEWWIL